MWPSPPPALELRGALEGGCAFGREAGVRCWGDLSPWEGPKAVRELSITRRHDLLDMCVLDIKGVCRCASDDFTSKTAGYTVRSGSERSTLPEQGFVAFHQSFGDSSLHTVDATWRCDERRRECHATLWQGPPILSAHANFVLAGGRAFMERPERPLLPERLAHLGAEGELIDEDGRLYLGRGRAAYGAAGRWTRLEVKGRSAERAPAPAPSGPGPERGAALRSAAGPRGQAAIRARHGSVRVHRGRRGLVPGVCHG